MPVAGVDTAQEKAGHLRKLGSLFRGREFENSIKEILRSVYKTMPEKSRSDELNKLILDKYKTDAYVNDPNPDNRIDDGIILEALAGQLTRFGTFEAMFISMTISSKEWEKNELLKKFMEQVRKEHPEVRHYEYIGLPALIQNAKVVKTIDLDQGEMDQSKKTASVIEKETQNAKKAANNINGWLQEEINKKDQLVGTISKSEGVALVTAGVLSSVSGILLAALSISSIATFTGVGLIFAAALLIGVGCYLLWKSNYNYKPNDNEVNPEAQTRELVNKFLGENYSADLTKEDIGEKSALIADKSKEKEAEPDKSSIKDRLQEVKGESNTVELPSHANPAKI